MEFKHYGSHDEWDRELADAMEMTVEELVRLLAEEREVEVDG